jgi:ABC-type methionine transport system ATPase subunit
MESLMKADRRLTSLRIRIRISKSYHQEPVISQLVSTFHLTVNITAAILGANANGDGWFDLELRGELAQIQAAIEYINDLGLEIWRETDPDGW